MAETPAVSLSRALGTETARHPGKERDNRETAAETPSLKALARLVLDRDSRRDTDRDSLSRKVPQKPGSTETAVSPVSGVSTVSPDDLEERAAIIEYGAGVPRAWAEGFSALCTMPPPTGFSTARWQRIIDATGTFLDRWAARAAECGWSDLDVFGADPDRPDARFDAMGLVLLLDRCEIAGIDAGGADLVTSTGARQRFRRRPLPASTISLWDLVKR